LGGRPLEIIFWRPSSFGSSAICNSHWLCASDLNFLTLVWPTW